MPTLDDLEIAFEFVSSAADMSNQAVYDREKDTFLWSGDAMDESEIPEDADWDQLVEVPHKNDLDLGKELVFSFVSKHLQGDLDHVYEMFSKRGAYQRFKSFLERRNKLQQWYDFENDATTSALIQWCKENNISIRSEPTES